MNLLGLIETNYEHQKNLLIAIIDANKQILPISETILLIENFFKKSKKNLPNIFNIHLSNFTSLCQNLDLQICITDFIECCRDLKDNFLNLRSAEFLWQSEIILNENKINE